MAHEARGSRILNRLAWSTFEMKNNPIWSPQTKAISKWTPTDASISPDAKNERNASKSATPQGSISPAAVGSRSGGHRTCRISNADYQDVCRINNRGHKCTRHKWMACRLNSCPMSTDQVLWQLLFWKRHQLASHIRIFYWHTLGNVQIYYCSLTC